MSLLGWVSCVAVGAACGVAMNIYSGSLLAGGVTAAVVGFMAALIGAEWERMWR